MKKICFIFLVLTSLSCYAQNLDIEILRKINIDRNTHLDKTFQTISNSAFIVSIAPPLIFNGIGFITGNRELNKNGLTFAAAYILNDIVTESLKQIINRPRPFVTYPEIQKLSSGGNPSFPSGHTSAAFATATSLSLAYPKWYVIVPGYVWASSVAYSRMHLGVHYPSDVLAGAIVGAGCAYLCYKGQKWLNNKHKNKHK